MLDCELHPLYLYTAARNVALQFYTKTETFSRNVYIKSIHYVLVFNSMLTN
jgi:hypothetical protein